jgi:hypothetical protein
MAYLRPITRKQSQWAVDYRCDYCEARARVIPGRDNRIVVIHTEWCKSWKDIQQQFPALARSIREMVGSAAA